MSAEDEDKKKTAFELLNEKQTEDDSDQTGESGETGESGQGGQTGQIAFTDFLASGKHLREDLLPDEIKRLLAQHNDVNEASVKKQKDKRDQYKALKEGLMKLRDFREKLGRLNEYRNHPILSNKAQFSGIDKQVNALPSEAELKTNDAPRNELENQYRLRYAPTAQPRFNPKPSIGR